MQVLLQQAVIGLTNGLLFALIALGYSLVYSVLGLVNFAHGDVFMLAGLVALAAMHLAPAAAWQGLWLGPATLALMLFAALFAALLNVAIDRLLFRPARKSGAPLAPLVTAIGTSLILQNLGLLFAMLPFAGFGGASAAAAPKAFLQPFGASNLLPAGAALYVSAREVLAAGVALAALVVLELVVRRSRLGRAMRAVAQDRVAAELMGIDADRTVAWAFALAGALAGVAAVVYGLFIGTVHYQMGMQNGLYAFAAAVTGGLGSLTGAVLGALLLGLTRAFSDQWLGSQWQPAVVFGCLLALLVIKPSGLLGRSREKV